ncbi:amino acid adenylation domain-containing protein [Pantoea sp. MBD-2R]|uniref:amino acid adenylation domain-containing protein n=1 Tax=Pantoea sp. MBD-2R TaxID=3141540 RepID=UPI003183D33B
MTDLILPETQTSLALPLVAAQPGIWMADQIAGHRNIFAVAHYSELHGDLNRASMDRAIRMALAEADTLHARFGLAEDGTPMQWIPETASVIAAEWYDLSQRANPKQAALSLMQEDLAAELPADGDRPLYRHVLMRISDDCWFWYQRYHHLMVDGFSFEALTSRIAALYTFLQRKAEPTASPFTSFAEVVTEYQQWQGSAQQQRAAAHWQHYTAELPEAVTLARREAGAAASAAPIKQQVNLSGDALAPLQQHAGLKDVTEGDIASALLILFLARISGRHRLSVGFPFMRRMGSAALSAIGPVVNVLPLIFDVSEATTLPELVQQLQREVKQARRFQRYEAEDLRRDLGLVGSGSKLYGPVINVKVYHQPLELAGIEARTHTLAMGPVDDLEFEVGFRHNQLQITLVANPARFDARSLQRHGERISWLFTQLAQQPQLTCGELSLLTPAEAQLIEQANHTAVTLPQETLQQAIIAQTALTPDALALLDVDCQLSYRQMLRQAELLADRLIEAGVIPGDIVAVALPRSVRLSITLTAILLAGAAWLPLDTGYPDERLALMVEDARPVVVITESALATRFTPLGTLLAFDRLADEHTALRHALPPVNVDRPAYVLYTSGSTGKPKGVVVGQQAIVNRLRWMQDAYPLDASDVILQKTPCSFDVSVWEFFWPLMTGAQLMMAPPDAHRDPDLLWQLIDEYRITTLHFVPSMLAAFVGHLQQPNACPTLKRVFCSGEALSCELARSWQALCAAPLHNLYGPTEAAVDVTFQPASGEALAQCESSGVPIGRPVWNTQLYILDHRLRPVPVGVAGDLYLGGVQLAEGYLHRADLTAQRFVASPFGQGERMYRTGDIACWNEDGGVDYLGRSDDQLKIRGQRIEPGEIEQALQALPGVAVAVVAAKALTQKTGAADNRQLLAWLIAEPGFPLDTGTVKAQLNEVLPAHMQPVSYLLIDKLPLSANGKLDRKALPLPQLTPRAGRVAQSEKELLLAGAFCELSGCNDVFMEDDFFALGGDSISAMGLSTAARRAGYQLRPRDIFAERSIGRIANIMQPLTQHVAAPRVAQQGAVGGLPILHWFNEWAGINARFVHSVYLAVPPQLTQAQLENALHLLAEAHPVLRSFTRAGQLIVGETATAVNGCYSTDIGDASRDSAAEQAFLTDAQRIDPAAGIMMQAALLQQHQQSVALVLTVHHLVVDGVSWRVLLEALRDAAMNNVTPSREETSLHDWSAYLLATLDQRIPELGFWQQMLQNEVPRLGLRALTAQDNRRQARQKRTLLNVAQTQALLGSLPQQYRATTEELLLTLLSLALRQRFNASQFRFTLESHGRAELEEWLDLSRTLGWLTTVYPVAVTLPDNPPGSDSVRAIKQVLRAVPDRGVGYGQLRWLDANRGSQLAKMARQHAPEVLFNYLGRFSHSDDEWSPLRTANQFRDTFAVMQEETMPLLHALELNIFVDEQAQRLALNWGWAAEIFSEADIDALHQSLSEAADALIHFARQHPQQAQNTLVAAEIPEQVDDALLQQLTKRYGLLTTLLPLLPLQQGLLFHAQTTTQQGSYNTLTSLTLSGVLPTASVQAALNAVVRHHPQLAARFDSDLCLPPMQLLPLLHNESHWPLEEITLPEMSAAEEAAAITEWEKQALQRDLFRQPVMLHALLIRHGQRATLLLNAHHLVVDGWSTPVIVSDLLTVLWRGEQALKAHSYSYADIVRQLSAREVAQARTLWQASLQDVRPTLLFEEAAASKVHEIRLKLEPGLERGLLALCRSRGLTLNTLMQGIWGLQLAITSGQNDVVFGSPVSGRFGQIDGLDQHVGLFSNTLPVRIRYQPERSLPDQLFDHQKQQIQLIEQDCLGLADIQQLAGCGTLFDTLLVVENYPDNQTLLTSEAGIRCEAIHNRGYTHYPLTLLVLPHDGLTLIMEYRDTVTQPRRFAERLLLLLEQLVRQPDLPLAQWQLQTAAEQALIADVNRTQLALPAETLQQAIRTQAALTPDALALRDVECQLSYRQMLRQAELLADRLIEAGVIPGDIVAVALPRSARLSVALTAVLLAGGAWLPLDTGYPDERLALMVDDARPVVIITESSLASRFSSLGMLLTFDRFDTVSRPQHALPSANVNRPAYVLYTSGSTGKPKGVVVGQQAIVNRLRWMQHEYPLQADDVILQKTPCSFDVSVWEFFWPLITGAQLMMAPPDAHRDPEILAQLIADYQVSTLHFVPSMLSAFVGHLQRQHGTLSSLKRVFCSGEALSCELAYSWQALCPAPLHNLYGPTEAAVDVTYQPASGEALESCAGPGVPIGRPVWNTQLHILDSLLRPVPVGVPGDLYLGGVQLAEGYLYRADLTSQRFVASPFAEGERMYRTGDIASWREDGAVDYLGRSDDQLKIRGQRIEPGEIEQALQTLPGVATAIVAAKALTQQHSGADNRQLLAWLVAEPHVALDTETVKTQLAAILPAHMQPVSYMLIEHLPLSANGKLDRKALPLPQLDRAAGRVPQSDSEKLLAGLFCALLNRERVFADDDFFALGGHSLLAMQLAAELRRNASRSLSIGQIITARSVEKLAALLDGADGADDAGNAEVLPLRSGTGPTLFCLHPASGFAWQYSSLLHYLGGDYPVVGLQSPRPSGVIAACDSVDAMCDRHLATLRQLQPHGPYWLLGYSLGGSLAQGIATRLQQAGEEVAFLGLLDTYPSEGQAWRTPDEMEAQQEVAREQAQFMASTEEESDPQLLAEKAAMFNTIVANYKDAVARLSVAKTARFDGKATLFMAQKTVPEGMDVPATWAPFVGELEIWPLNCEHADILSAESLTTLGPLLDRLLTR